MANTDLHNQAKPTPGGSKDTWGSENNDLWDYYDKKIPLPGKKSNRPSAADVPDNSFFRVTEGTEKGALFQENADSWDKLPVDVDDAFIATQLDTPIYSDDSNAPNKCLYWDSSDTQLEYKDTNGTIHSSSGATDTRTDVSDGGSTVVSDTEDINFASNLSVTDDGDSTVTVDVSGSFSNYTGIQASELPDGEAIRERISVEDGDTLEILNWGVQTTSDTTPSGLTVELQKADGTTIHSDNSAYETGSPLYTEDNNSGSVTHYRFAFVNSTGSDFTDNNSPSGVLGDVTFRRS